MAVLHALIDAAGKVIVLDRLTPREAARRNDALRKLHYAYEWKPTEERDR